MGRLTWVRLLQEQRYPVLQVHAGSFSVFVIRQTLDMDYRIVNVRNVIILMRACSHRELGTHTDNESAQHFLLGKIRSNISCAPDGVRTSGRWIWSPTLSVEL